MTWYTLTEALKKGHQITITGVDDKTHTGRILSIANEGGEHYWIVQIHKAKPGNCGFSDTVCIKTID